MTNQLDYAAIGRRIRARRQERQLSQFALAELCDMSPTNLSHIEHGSTKLSLPAVAAIANALDSSLDALLFDSLRTFGADADRERLSLELRDCTPEELRILGDTLAALKRSLRRGPADRAGSHRETP